MAKEAGGQITKESGLDMERLNKQIEFIVEIDKLKHILRQTLLIDKSRRENDAEHSWHLAMMAMILKEYAAGDIDLERVMKMVLIHDIVEIDAGDTFAYDEDANADKEERELEAAERIFSLLPEDQGNEIRALWDEFEEGETADALFAASMDRLQPLIHNHFTSGHTWAGAIRKDQVIARMSKVKKGAPALWQIVQKIVDENVEKGLLKV
ncbi:MAG TPA: HD domain-containing protein [Bacillota bacterium]|nr:HD domain-containing protein [Bacillota bacterium]